MDLTTSVILIVIFIVIQQVAILYAMNKIDKLARERDIYKDRLGNKNVTLGSYELHTSDSYSTFVQTLQEQKKKNEELEKKIKAKDDWIKMVRKEVEMLEEENKNLVDMSIENK